MDPEGSLATIQESLNGEARRHPFDQVNVSTRASGGRSGNNGPLPALSIASQPAFDALTAVEAAVIAVIAGCAKEVAVGGAFVVERLVFALRPASSCASSFLLSRLVSISPSSNHWHLERCEAVVADVRAEKGTCEVGGADAVIADSGDVAVKGVDCVSEVGA